MLSTLRRVFKICKRSVYALSFTIVSWQDESSWWLWLSLRFMSCDRGIWFNSKSNKTIVWLSCPCLFHDFLPHVTKRSLQNMWLNHPLLYESSWMGIANPVFVQLHFLECFSQASARDSVCIIYILCKCYQLFENSIKCYQEHLQILASSHIAKDVES